VHAEDADNRREFRRKRRRHERANLDRPERIERERRTGGWLTW
jgi:hypothetical protein